MALVGDGDATCAPDPMVLDVKAAAKSIALMPTEAMVEAEIEKGTPAPFIKANDVKDNGTATLSPFQKLISSKLVSNRSLIV